MSSSDDSNNGISPTSDPDFVDLPPLPPENDDDDVDDVDVKDQPLEADHGEDEEDEVGEGWRRTMRPRKDDDDGGEEEGRGEEEFKISLRSGGAIMSSYRDFASDVGGGRGGGLDPDLEGGHEIDDDVGSAAPPSSSYSSCPPANPFGYIKRASGGAFATTSTRRIGSRGSATELDDIEILDDSDDVLGVEEYYGEIRGRAGRSPKRRRRYWLGMALHSRAVRRSAFGAVAAVVVVAAIGAAMSASSGAGDAANARENDAAVSSFDVVDGDDGSEKNSTAPLPAGSYRKYEPQWFDRATGWQGSTFREAMVFCSGISSFITERAMTLCPYEAMCPMGRHASPAMLSIETDGSQRSPILDVDDELVNAKGGVWVYLGGENMCTGEMWNATSEDSAEEIAAVTGHVMCCVPVAEGQIVAEAIGEFGGGDVGDVAEEQIVAENIIIEAEKEAGELGGVASAVTSANNSTLPAGLYQTFEPQWFDRATGWQGSTFLEAMEFCSGISSFITERPMTLCPYGAMCPMGRHASPAMLSTETDGSQRSPILDVDDELVNAKGGVWVYLGGENMCTGEMWNATSEDSAEEVAAVTGHVMCCAPVDADNVAGQNNGTEADEDPWVLGDVLEPAPVSTASMSTTIATTPATVAVDVSTVSMTTAVTTTPVMVDWGGVELNNEMDPPTASASTIASDASATSESVLVADTLQSLVKQFSPSSWDRTSGWKGQTYSSALQFCTDLGSHVPCPYEAYCPLGPGQHVVGGVKSTPSYAPLMSIPNGWVSIGPDNTCMPYNAYNSVPPEWGLTGDGNEEITRHIMCCAEPIAGSELYLSALEDDGLEYDIAFDAATTSVERSEAEQSMMDKYHPVWYSRRQGYHGTNIDEAEQFCNNVAGKTLCPLEAVCPDGPPYESTHKSIFLDRPSFDGEQWAPIRGRWSGDNNPDWVAIGAVGGVTTSICATFTSLQGAVKLWDGGDGLSEYKQYVLCCAKEATNREDSLEEILKIAIDPIWYGEEDGWKGGSLDDASEFCHGRNGREICPYPAYCPYGAGKSVMGGHQHDFDREGEQWAPASNNMWVMIGQKYRNSATTCTVGSPPPAGSGVDDEVANLKKHVMCCRTSPGG